MPLVENFSEFAARQNCEYIQTENTDFQNAWIFANGAACIQERLLPGQPLATREPPTERFALLHAKRTFVATKRGLVAEALRVTMRNYQEQATNAVKYPHQYGQVSPHAVDDLKDRWEYLGKLQSELGEIDKELAASPTAILERQRRESVQEADAAQMQARQQSANQLAALANLIAASPNGPPSGSQDITDVVGRYLEKSSK